MAAKYGSIANYDSIVKYGSMAAKYGSIAEYASIGKYNSSMIL